MPTVLNERGFRFMIYLEDHPPAHVHVHHQGCKVVIEFEDEIRTRNRIGMTSRDVARAVRVIEQERDYFLGEWRRIHE